MDFVECVRRDRATREFTDDPVSEDEIESLIDAARQAGSGKNRQPWSFLVVQDRDRLDELAELGKYTTPLQKAPVGIVLLVDDQGSRGDLDPAVFDCGRAFQNMKLAATDMGFGSVPQSVDGDRAEDLLEVPDGKHVLIVLALGHPAESDDTIEGEDKEDVLAEMGRSSLDELIHWETY